MPAFQRAMESFARPAFQPAIRPQDKEQASAPIANFVWVDNGNNTVSFTDTSLGFPNAWLWTFGDGSPDSTVQNPVHTYTTAGPHTVTLTATNPQGSDDDTDSVTINPSEPIADYTYVDQQQLNVAFTDTSVATAQGATITGWSWDFGDGSAAGTTQNPTHTYATSGTKTVVLTVTDSYGATGVESAPVDVSQPVPPVADFTWADNLDNRVSFTDTSTNTPTSWNWDFGDGSADSTQQNPTHVFEAAGPWTVTLTATNSDGSDDEAKAVTINPAEPAANYTYVDNLNLNVSFTDTSTPVAFGATITAWDWDWGDATAHGTTQHPNHTYSTSGTKTVVLTVTNSYGATDQESKQVVVAPATVAPVANFTFADLLDNRVSFTDTSTNTPTSWSWDFGDGSGASSAQNPTHLYEDAGPFDVTLTAANAAGSDGETKSVSVNVAEPVANYTYVDNGDRSVSFTDTSTAPAFNADVVAWSWNFGDASPADTDQHPTHTYATSGAKTVVLTVTDSYGTQDSESKSVTVSTPAALVRPNFTPLTLSSFVFYWLAGDGSTRNPTVDAVGDSEPVAGWTSEGTNTLELAQVDQALRPTFRLSVPELGNRSGLECDGDWLEEGINSLIAGLDTYSIHILAANLLATKSGLVYAEGNTANANPKLYAGFASSGNDVIGRHQGSATMNMSSGAYTASNAEVISLVRSAAASFTLYLNGTSVATSSTTPGTTTLNTIAIGALVNASGAASDFLGWVNFVGVRTVATDVATVANALLAYAGE